MSPDPTATQPPTAGKGNRAPTDGRYVRDIFEQHRLRLARIETTNNQQPMRLHELTDTPLMAQAPAGHAATYDVNTGMYVPSPNLAILTFDLIGGVVTGSSPPHWARYSTMVLAFTCVLGTVGAGGSSFDLELNGSPIGSATATTTPVRHALMSGPVAVNSYTDLLTVFVTVAGAGDADLIVQVELGSNVAGQPGPAPFGGP